jgi:hypothetical protein
MSHAANHLLTPVYLKLDEATPWPEDRVFYLLSRDGLMLCRNDPFFSSCVAADRWPNELARQRPFLKLDFPRLSRADVERVVAFFALVAQRHNSEAAVLITANRETRKIELVVPDQVGTVGTTYQGFHYALDLFYEIPPLPPDMALIGDIHSHADNPAYASWTDQADEAYRPGIHLVVGRVQCEPPDFHCAVTADGARFQVNDLHLVMEDYHQRRPAEVPPEWLARLTVEEWARSKRRVRSLSERNGTARPLFAPGQGEQFVAARSHPSLTPRSPAK